MVFSLVSIKKSELRVFKYLDFQANLTTPCDFIEILLETFGEMNGLVEIKILYMISIKILEVFYCQRDEIYSKLFHAMTGREKTKNDK